jgi:hypothetical protein
MYRRVVSPERRNPGDGDAAGSHNVFTCPSPTIPPQGVLFEFAFKTRLTSIELCFPERRPTCYAQWAAMLPPRHDGQNACCFPEASQSLRAKINHFTKTRNKLTFPPVPRFLRRAFRDRYDTWRGMRWTRICRQAGGGCAYGQAVWS